MTDIVSQAVAKNNGFWAFSTEQFLNQYKKTLTPYVNLGGGLYAPKKEYKKLIKDVNNASNEIVKIDKMNNSNKDIIWRELQNHEAQYTDTSDTIEALKNYGISADEVNAEYDKYIKSCSRYSYLM